MGEIIRPTSTTDVGTVTNPTNVYDGNLGTHTDINAQSSGPSDADTSSCVANFPSYTSGTMQGYILRSKHSGSTSASGDDVPGGNGSGQILVQYSTNGGSSYTNIAILTSVATRNMVDADSLSEETVEVQLSGGQDISQVKVKYLCETTAGDGTGNADIDAFETWIETIHGAGGSGFVG